MGVYDTIFLQISNEIFERFFRSLPERPEKIRLCLSPFFFTGASQFLVGLGSVISCVSEAVMFFGIFYIFRHFSHATFMAIGLVGYIFRFCVFASVTNPWLVLPVEIFQGGYIYLLWQCFSSVKNSYYQIFNNVNQPLFATSLVRD